VQKTPSPMAHVVCDLVPRSRHCCRCNKCTGSKHTPKTTDFQPNPESPSAIPQFGNRRGERPQVNPGYYTTKHQPMNVYLCHPSRGDDVCPGGDPQTCKNNLAGLTCSACEQGWSRKGDKCEKCSPGNAAVLVILPLIGIIVCAVVYYSSNREIDANSNVMLGCSCVFGMAVTVVQILATLGQMTLPWPPAMKNILSDCKFFVANPGVFGLECMAEGNNPVNQFLVRFFIPLAVVLEMLICYAIAKALGCKEVLSPRLRWTLPKVMNSILQTYTCVFIALTAITAVAFQCYSRPNGDSSLAQYPTVLCGSDDHQAIIALSVILLITFVVPFIGLQVWANFHIVKVRANPQLSALHLARFRFLIYRFRPDRWWWGTVFTIRQTFLAFAPVLQPDDPHAQTVYLTAVLTVYAVHICYFWPWKSDELNCLDAVSMVLLVILVVAVTSYMPRAKDSSSHAGFMESVMIVLASSVVVAAIYIAFAIWSGGKPNLQGAFGFNERRWKTKQALRRLTEDLYKLCGSIQAAPSKDLVAALLLMNSYDLRSVQGCIDVFKACTVASIAGKPARVPMRLVHVPHSWSQNPVKFAETQMMSEDVAGMVEGFRSPPLVFI